MKIAKQVDWSKGFDDLGITEEVIKKNSEFIPEEMSYLKIQSQMIDFIKALGSEPMTIQFDAVCENVGHMTASATGLGWKKIKELFGTIIGSRIINDYSF